MQRPPYIADRKNKPARALHSSKVLEVMGELVSAVSSLRSPLDSTEGDFKMPGVFSGR